MQRALGPSTNRWGRQDELHGDVSKAFVPRTNPNPMPHERLKIGARGWAVPIGLGAAILVGAGLAMAGHPPAVCWTGSVTAVCAVWWIFEPLPVAATALLPLAVFPLAGVLTPVEVAEAYGNDLILLMLGGFLLSAAMERSGAHRRIALQMVNAIGNRSGRRLVVGFMLASAILSMWISNAATTLMLLPIALAVVRQSECREFQLAMLLGIAYAASIGGIATPIGTPPNLVFMQNIRIVTGDEPGFVQWMMWTLPIVAILFPLAAWQLTRRVGDIGEIELPAVGRWRTAEVRTLMVFAIVASLWVTRKQPWGGWAAWLEMDSASDASVALLGAVGLFLIPSGDGDGHTACLAATDEPAVETETTAPRLLDWPTAARIPWSVLLLFAGGICIARAFQSSGLSLIVGQELAALAEWHPLVVIGCICLIVTFLTEVTSNTATANVILPILAATAVAADSDLRLWMFPATISCSFAFMLPVATPPNAIVFGSEQVTVKQMARHGLALNLLGVPVIAVVSYLWFG